MPRYNLVRFKRKYDQRFIIDLKIYLYVVEFYFFKREYMKGTYQEKFGVISQTLWIQNVVNFNHALVLPPLLHREKKKEKKKKEETERERE